MFMPERLVADPQEWRARALTIQSKFVTRESAMSSNCVCEITIFNGAARCVSKRPVCELDVMFGNCGNKRFERVSIGFRDRPGVVGKQDLDFLVKVPRGRFLRTREILDRAFERDRRQHSDHEFQGYCLPSTISGAIQLTVKDGRYDVFERFLEVLRAKPEVRRAYNELKRDWNLRSMNGYRATKAAF